MPPPAGPTNNSTPPSTIGCFIRYHIVTIFHSAQGAQHVLVVAASAKPARVVAANPSGVKIYAFTLGEAASHAKRKIVPIVQGNGLGGR